MEAAVQVWCALIVCFHVEGSFYVFPTSEFLVFWMCDVSSFTFSVPLFLRVQQPRRVKRGKAWGHRVKHAAGRWRGLRSPSVRSYLELTVPVSVLQYVVQNNHDTVSYLHARWGSTVQFMEEGEDMQTTPPAGIYVKGASPATPQPKWTKHSNPKHCNKTTANHSVLFGKKITSRCILCRACTPTTAHSPYPLLSSISLAVIGCVLKRSLVLRPAPGPPGR